MKETYKINTTCKNCSNQQIVVLPRGINVKAIESKECNYCGCKQLKDEGMVRECKILPYN